MNVISWIGFSPALYFTFYHSNEQKTTTTTAKLRKIDAFKIKYFPKRKKTLTSVPDISHANFASSDQEPIQFLNSVEKKNTKLLGAATLFICSNATIYYLLVT